MHPVNELFRTYLFLIPLIVLLLTEMAKVCVRSVQEGQSIWSGQWIQWLFKPGGIPSSHSAFVTSLLIIVARKSTFESVDFAIAFVFASIVWYDALSVRYQVGKQAEVLNRLQHWKHFSEKLGHSFFEVVAGIAFGSVVTAFGIWLS
jgi:hypothetical protein